MSKTNRAFARKSLRAKRCRVLNTYSDSWTSDETTSFAFSLATVLCSMVHDSRENEVLTGFIRNRDIIGLCNHKPDPSRLCSDDYRHSCQVIALFSKRDDLDLGEHRRLAALLKFYEAEQLCGESNDLFRLWRRGMVSLPPRVCGVLHAAAGKISSLLGEVPSLADLKFRFGPGATTSIKRKNSNARYKLGAGFQCSSELLPLCSELLAEFPSWAGLSDDRASAIVEVEIHNGRWNGVPKNWKTDRGVVVEPALNTLFQNGVGRFLKQRLRLVGVDIRDQTRNQRLARYGSLTGALATLDLSSASDTISKELVAELLPLDWYIFLSYGRTSVIDTPFGAMRQEKFSSMGNGFTFPLETLIFWALSSAATEAVGSHGDVSVYGDDIIVPVEAVRLLTQTLEVCGFLVNPKKSFYHGSFRESCGKDYLTGKLVRPAFVKTKLDAAGLFVLHNHFRWYGDDRLCQFVLGYIAPKARIYGPEGYGDGHLHSDDDQLFTKHRGHFKNGFGGRLFSTYTWRPKRTSVSSKADHIYPSYRVYERHSMEPEDDPVSGGTYDSPVTRGEEVSWWSSLPGKTKTRINQIYIF